MRNDHRRPLVAYGFVSLACALVVTQPSMTSLTGGIPGRDPVVTLLTDTGFDTVLGLPTIHALRAAVGELPDDDFTPGFDPLDALGASPSGPAVAVVDAPVPQAGPSSGTALSAALIGPGDGGTPGPGTPDGGDAGVPDDGGLFGTPGSDTPRGSKGNGADDDGPKPHQFGAGHGHPYATAQPSGPGAARGGQDDGKPGPKDKGDKPGKGPKDKGDKPGKGPKDKGDKPGKGPKDKGRQHHH